MALDDLKEDLVANQKDAATILARNPDNPIMKHITNTMWPWMEALLEEVGEQALALDEAIDERGDMLQHETAGEFAAVILACTWLCDELDKRLTPSEVDLRTKIATVRDTVASASVTLEEITLPPSVDDDEDDDEEPEDDDDKEA